MLAADASYMPNVDRIHYSKGPTTDADGRVTLPALIPAPCTVSATVRPSTIVDKGVQVRKDFTVGPGETLDLGDILIEKPRS